MTVNKSVRLAGIISPFIAVIGVLSPLAAQEPRIREGTALARLVNEVRTQTPDITIATVSAPGVKIDIPPWLAAHYRRNHSEVPKVVSQQDPTGGYPLALENLYVWMLQHQDLQPSTSRNGDV
jgi:hypothetical protein